MMFGNDQAARREGWIVQHFDLTEALDSVYSALTRRTIGGSEPAWDDCRVSKGAAGLAQTTILVVEDDAAIRRGLCDALAFAGYAVAECARGDVAVERALASSPDLLLLDVLLPGKDGFEILRELRASHPQLPVILLTARGAEEDRVRGLKLGADDYVVKPFSASELLARVEAVLRRSAERPRGLRTLRLGDRTIDLELGEIALASGEKLHLSSLESSIVRYLAAHRGRPVDRRELLQRVWGGNSREMETRTIDMHVRRLREKLEHDPAQPKLLVTVRNRGYMLVDSDGQEGA
jgi:DNA-binding response OmpR family regulator